MFYVAQNQIFSQILILCAKINISISFYMYLNAQVFSLVCYCQLDTT